MVPPFQFLRTGNCLFQGPSRRLRLALKKESFAQVTDECYELEDRKIGLGRLPRMLTSQLDTLLVKRLRVARLAEVEGIHSTGICQGQRKLMRLPRLC